LHFDLIICNKTFNETTCITHFINQLIFYNWVFSLMNHKKKHCCQSSKIWSINVIV
jgi:hypothetical protein